MAPPQQHAGVPHHHRTIAAAAAKAPERAARRQQQFVQVEADGTDAWRLDPVVEALKAGAVGIIPTGAPTGGGGQPHEAAVR